MGLAVPVDLADGKKGVDITYQIRPEAKWGDGVPVTTKDVEFTYEVGRDPQSAVGNAELYRRITSIDVKDDKTFTLHVDKLTFDYAAINDFVLLPEHIERAAFADPARYRERTKYVTDPTNPGLYNGPYRVTELAATDLTSVLEPNQYWAGPPRLIQTGNDRRAQHREYRRARSQSLVRHDRHGGGRAWACRSTKASLSRSVTATQFQIVYKLPGWSFEHVDLNLDRPADLGRSPRTAGAAMLGLDREAISTSAVRRLPAGRRQLCRATRRRLQRRPRRAMPMISARGRELLDAAGWHG